MSKLLNGKVAIITGGARGIGKAIAERFAQESCNLILVSRTQSELENTAKAIKNKYSVQVKICNADIGNEKEIKPILKHAVDAYGKIDILVNNAAIIGPMDEITNIDVDSFFNTLKVNIGGTIFCTQVVVPFMKNSGGGTIINLSGGGGLYPLPYYDAYSASKASIVRLTENFAQEFDKYGIMVTAISPGAVNTKMFDEQLSAEKDSIGEKNWQDLQNRLASGGDSIEKAPELALHIVSQKRPELNGRVISAQWDDWENIAKNTNKILDSDIYKMRRIVHEDRDVELS